LRTAQLLLDGDAEQAERAQLGPEVARELVRGVDLGGARRDHVLGEGEHRVAQQVGCLAEAEVEARNLVGDLPSGSFAGHVANRSGSANSIRRPGRGRPEKRPCRQCGMGQG
jgi:hypothetical protein